MAFRGTPWQPLPEKPLLSAIRTFSTCGRAEKMRSIELGTALLQVGCCHIELLMQRKQNYEGKN